MTDANVQPASNSTVGSGWRETQGLADRGKPLVDHATPSPLTWQQRDFDREQHNQTYPVDGMYGPARQPVIAIPMMMNRLQLSVPAGSDSGVEAAQEQDQPKDTGSQPDRAGDDDQALLLLQSPLHGHADTSRLVSRGA